MECSCGRSFKSRYKLCMHKKEEGCPRAPIGPPNKSKTPIRKLMAVRDKRRTGFPLADPKNPYVTLHYPSKKLRNKARTRAANDARRRLPCSELILDKDRGIKILLPNEIREDEKRFEEYMALRLASLNIKRPYSINWSDSAVDWCQRWQRFQISDRTRNNVCRSPWLHLLTKYDGSILTRASPIPDTIGLGPDSIDIMGGGRSNSDAMSDPIATQLLMGAAGKVHYHWNIKNFYSVFWGFRPTVPDKDRQRQ